MEKKFVIRDLKFQLYFVGKSEENPRFRGMYRINEFEDDIMYAEKFDDIELAEKMLKTLENVGIFEILPIYIK
jgi:hypothetical protein